MLKGTGNFLVLRDGRLASDPANEENEHKMVSLLQEEASQLCDVRWQIPGYAHRLVPGLSVGKSI
jgi:hypothetical protein